MSSGSAAAPPITTKATAKSTPAPTSSRTPPKLAAQPPEAQRGERRGDGGDRDHEAALSGAQPELRLEVHRHAP